MVKMLLILYILANGDQSSQKKILEQIAEVIDSLGEDTEAGQRPQIAARIAPGRSLEFEPGYA